MSMPIARLWEELLELPWSRWPSWRIHDVWEAPEKDIVLWVTALCEKAVGHALREEVHQGAADYEVRML